MKKYLLSTAVLTGLIFTSSAQAAELNPYVGADLVRYNVSYDDYYDQGLDDSLDGLNVHVGSRFHKNFGAELGYFRTGEESKDVNLDLSGVTGVAGDTLSSTKVKLSGFTLDGLAYLPVSEKVDLIGTAGVSWTKADITLTGVAYGTPGSISDDDSEFGVRGGVGAQVNLTDKIGARAIARYQTADFSDTTDNLWIYSAGLNYSF